MQTNYHWGQALDASGLIPHFYYKIVKKFAIQYRSVNALSGLYLISTSLRDCKPRVSPVACQCPLGLIPHFYERRGIYGIHDKLQVSMPSRAYTSFLRYPFKNLGFMRFPEPVFAGIYQNILTTAVFRAC